MGVVGSGCLPSQHLHNGGELFPFSGGMAAHRLEPGVWESGA
jgi:hypothetical protein